MSPAFHLFFFFLTKTFIVAGWRENKKTEKSEKTAFPWVFFLSCCFSVLVSLLAASSFFPELFPSLKVRLQKQAKKNWIRCERTEGKHTALFKRFYSNFTMTTGRWWYTLQIYAEKLLLIVHLNLSKKKNSGTRLSAYIYIILEF